MHRPLRFPPPTPSTATVQQLEKFLGEQADWMTAEQIGFQLGWSDRKVRKVASESDQVVSHPGGDGYKLEERCNEDEFRHFGNALIAQARSMVRRWRKVYNRRRNRQRDQGLLPL